MSRPEFASRSGEQPPVHATPGDRVRAGGTIEIGEADVLGDLLAGGKLDDVPFDVQEQPDEGRAG